MEISRAANDANIYEAGRTNGNSKTDKSSSRNQANRANKGTQAYLKELKEKYPNVNITVADFQSEKQSDAYMLGSRGYNNIAVSSSMIEKMASDPAAAAKYEKVFAEMSGNAERVEKFAKENKDEILGAGAVIDKNGKVSYWMVGRSKDQVENPGTVYKEKVQKQIKEKREKKKEEEAAKAKRLEKAETLERLLAKISGKEQKNETVTDKTVKETGKGAQLDITI